MKPDTSICLTVIPLMVLSFLSSVKGTGFVHANVFLFGTSSCETEKTSFCRQNNINPYGKINTKEPIRPSVFHDLTRTEMKGLRRYLFSSKVLNLTVNNKATYKSNYLYIAELYLPPKAVVLNYLDKGYKKPRREAHVTLIMGGVPDPHVLEIIVGPLPNPRYHKYVPYRPKKIPFIQRPITSVEFLGFIRNVGKQVHTAVGTMLFELYGGRIINCGKRCLKLAIWSTVIASLANEQKRLHWFSLNHFVEYWILRPLDFAVLIDKTAENFYIVRVWFDGKMFESLTHVKNYYLKNKDKIQKVRFPSGPQKERLSVNRRGDYPFSAPLQNPTQISPDGKRYDVRGRHIKYMFWEFHFGMSVVSGPKLFDIRFKKERIAYEISLQELTSFYSGLKPVEYTANFFDGAFLLGTLTKYLVPGVDCPGDSTFLGSYFISEGSTIYNAHSFCVFEFNTGMPLRRHHGYSHSFHRFYEGMETVLLTVRTIITADNYDYIVDFLFYHTGAIEVKVSASGVIIGSFYSSSNPYGFELAENLNGLIHQHMYHFKVDLDIKGTHNRFETLDIEKDATVFSYRKRENLNLHQVKFTRNLNSLEKEAALKYNLLEPKLLIISNNLKRDKYGNSASYRILNQGMSYDLRPPTEGHGPAQSWSQYQVAVTRANNSETKSSSVYAQYGSKDPVVRFQDFIDNNENIVDKDLVAWVTMGMYHIPSKEDLPVTHTPGISKSFFLLPFNYFHENPAMDSRNAVRVDPVDVDGKTVSVKVNRHGVKKGTVCDKQRNYWVDTIKKDPCLVVRC